MAARYPERVTRMAIVAGYVDGRGRRRAEPGPDAIRGVIAEGWGAEAGSFGVAFMMTYFPEGPFDTAMDLLRILQASCSREQALRQRDASNADSIATLLPRVRCPTCMIHGRHDGVHPLPEARKLAAGIAGAELVVLETANMRPLPGQPERARIMRTLVAFLAAG